MMDLEKIVLEYLEEEGPYFRRDFKALSTGRMKCKTSNMHWSVMEEGRENPSPIRVVKMDNTTDWDGTGDIKIQKENKPLCTFHLQSGVLKGFMQRVQFDGPPIGNSTLPFLAMINSSDTAKVIDYIGLTLKTEVPVQAQETKFTEVYNSTHTFEGRFTCKAKLSGKVVIIKPDDSIYEIELDELTALPKTFRMEGTLSVQYENKHKIIIRSENDR